MQTKKFFYLACAMLIAGCSEEVTDGDKYSHIDNDSIPIGIGVSEKADTRSEYSSANINAEGNTFKTWAYMTMDGTKYTLMDGVTATRTSTEWEYSPMHYWRNNASYDFYAVMPGSASATCTDGKMAISSIPLSSWTADGTDYMVADGVSGMTYTGDNVALDFNHIMSRLNVTVKDAEDAGTKTLTYLDIWLPSGTATYTQNASSAPSPSSDTWTWDGFTNDATGSAYASGSYTKYVLVNSSAVDGKTSAALDLKSSAQTVGGNLFVAPTPSGYSTADDLQVYINAKYTLDGKEYSFENVAVNDLYSFSQSKTVTLKLSFAVPKLTIDGIFSVSETTKVKFAKGNLQYDITNKKYQLADNQWTYLNNGSSYTLSNSYVTDTPANNVLDLFGWGTANNPTYGSTSYADYLGSSDKVGNPTENISTSGTNFSSSNDWGTAAAADLGVTMRTLTTSEWQYLYTNHCKTLVTLSTNDGQSILGLVIFPDGMDLTTATSYLGGNAACRGISDTSTSLDWSSTTMTENNLSASCALFLPAGGYRHGSRARYSGSSGNYWSATANSYDGDYYVGFYSSYVNPSSYNFSRYYGLSVRLAQDITE